MSPLPKHGRDASFIADTIKVLLNYNGREYDSFIPVRMELPEERFIIYKQQSIRSQRTVDISLTSISKS